ncbi:MAG: hypothetical protein DRR04_09625, partial [Gammaproteobacteria bacterium]
MLVQKSKLFTGCLIALIGFANSSFSIDRWDPDDDTAAGTMNELVPTLTIQTNGTHSLDASDTEDWFKLSLSGGTTYLFEATGLSDTEGYLYSDTNGTLVASNADDGEEGVNFLIIYTPPSAGDYYYLKVEEWLNGDADYVLNFKIALDAWDSGDDTGGGALFRPTDEFAHTEGPHSLTTTDTNDWYRFTLASGNTYRFESTGAWNTYGRLFSDASGTSEVVNDDQGGDADNFRVDYTPLVTDDYYLEVVQTNNPVEYANYDFSYKLIEDEWDSGDDAGSGATVLSPIDDALRLHGPHALSDTDTYDWYKVHLTAGQTYRFESAGDSDTEAYLFANSAGTVTNAYNDDFQPIEVSSNFQIIYTPNSTGNNYLRVTHSTEGNDAIYQLMYGIENELDGDDDGMPDAWEIQYFGSTNELPSANWDSDQFVNLDEYIAGTDPTNPASFFA